MDFIAEILASEAFIGMIMSILGIILTFIISRAAAAFATATGIQIEKVHQENLHEAIKSAVESALRHGPAVGAGTLMAHVRAHLQQSVPDALRALVPGDTVLDTLVERYYLEALGKYYPSEAMLAATGSTTTTSTAPPTPAP